MTPKERAAMQQALEALVDHGTAYLHHEVHYSEAITALREALAEQAEQEPDYFGLTHDHTWLSIDKKQYDKLKPEGRMACYVAPVRTKDLTDDEIMKINVDTASIVPTCDRQFHFARAVIQEYRRKNGIV